MGRMSDEWYIKNAPVREGEVEVDAGAIVSNGADRGAYVQAWVWVPDPDEEMPGPAVIELPAGTETAESLLDWHESLTLDSDRETGLTLWADALRDALERDTRASRLEVSAARGQRATHHGWNGAAWSERWSGCATMDTLTESEAAAVEDAITAADAALAEFAARIQQQADA
jgi:hypothetical protein